MPSPVRRSQQRCAAPGCRELLTVQNRVQCRICGQAVCIKHRFEDQHPCVDLEAAIKEALRLARAELRPEEYAEAHSTMVKVFSNVLKDPKNEKFRTLRKANAVVQEKLKHPACTQALLMCGFADEGDCFVCEAAADLSTMRRVCAQLKASLPPASGVRIVDGVIQRPPKAEAQEATAASPAKGYAASRSTPQSAVTGAKPRSAFDFQRRADRETREQAQSQALQELRQQQKERYKAEGAGTGTNRTPTASASAPPTTPASDGCALQCHRQHSG